MRCLKCGREIPDQQVFCLDCLEEMKKHPVKPNATVQLPVRAETPVVKKKVRKHRDTKPEDQIRRQQVVIRCLCAALAVSLAAFALCAVMLLHLMDQRATAPNIGQNYGAMTNNTTN